MTYTPTRRADFLTRAAALGTPGLWPAWMPRLAFAPVDGAVAGDVLVVVFLRGAADVLNLVVPHGEAAYYAARPTLAIARPDDNAAGIGNRALDLDGFFGLHPTMGALLPAWHAQQFAVIQACGAPDESRSHFQAMALMERGVEDERGPASGWIGRHLTTLQNGNTSPLRAVGFGPVTPRSLLGSVPAAALQSITDFHFQGDSVALQAFQRMVAQSYARDPGLGPIGTATAAVAADVQRLDPERYVPEGGAQYPTTDFGRALLQTAMLIKADLGLEVSAIDLGGWDTHFAQGASGGWMANLARDLADGLAAFHADLAAKHNRLTVVVMSEFGRRVAENASLGTDHGHGSAMLLLGGNVVGGRVHGPWPGLAPEQRVGPGDLAVTTDYRDVLGEVCRLRLGNAALDAIFPGYQAAPVGIVRR
ncbi:MAG: DUF1501 domain-containing protein [Anaerolineales bacterium]|nr:DUF1501 domain-containing protein [Anaerolineales bacterium]